MITYLDHIKTLFPASIVEKFTWKSQLFMCLRLERTPALRQNIDCGPSLITFLPDVTTRETSYVPQRNNFSGNLTSLFSFHWATPVLYLSLLILIQLSNCWVLTTGKAFSTLFLVVSMAKFPFHMVTSLMGASLSHLFLTSYPQCQAQCLGNS